MDIWSNFVQSLMLSDDVASMKLCYYLMKDKKAIYCWWMLWKPDEWASVPRLPQNNDFTLWIQNVHPEIVDTEKEWYLKELERKRKNR